MERIDGLYTNFHKERMGIHCYPSEFLIRTMLGKYPNMTLEKDYKGKRVLDLGFGDGRNMVLFANCGMDIHGIEITQDICDDVKKRMSMFGIEADLKVGRNNNIPYEDNYFDYIVSSSSMYYVDHGDSFENNLAEITRVLKPNGVLIAALAKTTTFILQGAIPLGNHHYECTNDPFGLRIGDVFRGFDDAQDVVNCFSPFYKNISTGLTVDDYYGLQQDLLLFVGYKK
jgi:SAM-dependent methyltransferase